MKKQEFVDKIQLYLKLLPTKEGEVIQLEKICLKVVDKLKAEKN